MRHVSVLSVLALTCALTTFACHARDDAASSSLPSVAPQAVHEVETNSQAITDPTGANFLVLGGSNVDLLGEDGEPDNLAGRLINGGFGVSAGSANENVWLLLGPTGTLTYLDEDGRPLRGDLLEVLEGNGVAFSTLGERRVQTGDIQSAWLIGGEEGRVQLVNTDGEPELVLKAQVFTNGSTVVAGGYSKVAEQWLVGNDRGAISTLDASLTPITSDPNIFPMTEIAGIVGNPASDASPDQRFVVAAGNQISYYPINTPLTFEGEVFTSLAEADEKLIAGTQSGKVALWDFGALDVTPTWVDALEGAAVKSIFWNGTSWLVLGEQGSARLVSAQGAALESVAKLGDGSTLVSARWAKDRWLIATSSSLVLETSDTLELLVSYEQPLGGAALYSSAPGRDLVVVAGDEGKYTTLTPQGEAMGEVRTLTGSSALRAASWSGTTFLIGGDAGIAQLLDAQGSPQGEPMTLLGGEDIGAIAWSGNFWLVAGARGNVQRVRPNGEVIGGLGTLAGFERINAARWSGDEWLVGGSSEGKGVVQRVKSDATGLGRLLTFNTITSINAVEWSGREWIVGGTDGLVQVISAAGEPRTQPGPQPRDVLTGATIHSIDFHDNTYLIAGENGLTRKVTQDLLTSTPPVAVAGFQTIYDVRWTLARGYGRGECLTNAACYVGECIGELQGGFCCDLACDRPCESCLASENGAVDGICSPTAAGSMPVIEGCDAEDASTCGLTGLCDGAGECALHGVEVVCKAASCNTGDVTPESLCDGAGECVTPATVACAPYLTCDGAGCGITCDADDDCAEGYECLESACEVKVEEVVVPPPPPAEEEGCCAIVAPKKETPSTWGLLGLLGIFLFRRRRRSA